MEGYYFDLKEYCSNCPEFNVMVIRSLDNSVIIACSHKKRCEKLVNYISKKEDKND